MEILPHVSPSSSFLLNLINTPSVSVIIASVLCPVLVVVVVRVFSADTFKKNVLQFRLCAPSSQRPENIFSSSTSAPKRTHSQEIIPVIYLTTNSPSIVDHRIVQSEKNESDTLQNQNEIPTIKDGK